MNDETYYLWAMKFFMEFNRNQGYACYLHTVDIFPTNDPERIYSEVRTVSYVQYNVLLLT
jgi:hypothetical protein